ncbi:hypothetical protein C8R46DRAFT_1282644 [Mycena filopes]|nr:hypothetical protein C8R46DRAFT_1282644 [Mycena filopes]
MPRPDHPLFPVNHWKPEDLMPKEIYWREHHDWLKASGYLARPRFRPGWIPSWKTRPTNVPLLREDAWPPPHGVALDAVRIRDNVPVLLKKIERDLHPHEVEIGQFFTDLGPRPANHCVPILEILRPPDDDNVSIIVMPLLRRYDSPRFDSIGEAVEFFRQIFEGLQFMHHHRVAHRYGINIFFSPGDLKPNSYSDATHYTRTRLPVKYYFIDFGLSRQYTPAQGPPFREDIIQGGDKSVPEFAGDNFVCDPFPTDIYYLGNLIRQEFLEVMVTRLSRFTEGRGFEFMKPLVDDMVQTDPTLRPDIDEVVTRFAEIQKDLSSWTLRSRVLDKQEFPYLPQRVVGHWYRRIRSVIMRVPAIPISSA